MQIKSLATELNTNTYPGRGIVLGKSKDGKKAVIAILLWAEAQIHATEFSRKTTAAEFAQRHLMSQKWKTRVLLFTIPF